MKKVYLLILPLCLIFISCQSGKKAYQKGNYQEAIYQALKRLKQSPDHEKSQQTVKVAYSTYIDYMENRIKNQAMMKDPLRWETIMSWYKQMDRIYEEIQRTPAAHSILGNARSYRPEWLKAREEVIAVRYELGKTALAQGEREAAIQAVDHFDRVLSLDQQYRDAQNLKNRAIEEATIYVMIAPSPIHTKYFQATHRFFEEEVEKHLLSRSPSPYVQFVPFKYNQSGKADVDHIIKMSFDDFVIGQAYVKESVKERVKDSVLVGTHQLADTTVHTYNTVKAELHLFQKEISSAGVLNLEVFDNYSNQLVTTQRFPASNIFYDEWGFYKGDKRALSKTDLETIGKGKPSPEPDPQTLFLELTRPVFNDVNQYLKRFYRN